MNPLRETGETETENLSHLPDVASETSATTQHVSRERIIISLFVPRRVFSRECNPPLSGATRSASACVSSRNMCARRIASLRSSGTRARGNLCRSLPGNVLTIFFFQSSSHSSFASPFTPSHPFALPSPLRPALF